MECGLSPGTVSALQGARGAAVVSRRLTYTRPAPTAHSPISTPRAGSRCHLTQPKASKQRRTRSRPCRGPSPLPQSQSLLRGPRVT